MQKGPLAVVALKEFQDRATRYWSDAEREEFVRYIGQYPIAGVVIPRSGGLRKVRWSRAGMGKSGGVRVIYYLVPDRGRLYLMTVYAKSEREDLTPKELKKFAKLAKDILEKLREKDH